MTDPETVLLHHEEVDHLPLLWGAPRVAPNSVRHLVIWLPGLGGRKESLRPYLQDLVQAGFYAVSFDPYQHGERMVETQEAFAAKLKANKRRYFWPMMTLTADEFPRIIDWGIARWGIDGRIMAGGISMGGDIAVTAAGLDPRIIAIAAGIATPDWLRPGTNEEQSDPDTYAWNCYQRSNPLTNLQRYVHCPAITFQIGAQDDHVPPDGARRFMEALRETYSACPERLNRQEHPVGHEFTPNMWENALDWFRLNSLQSL